MADITILDIIGYVIVLVVLVELLILTIKLFNDYNKDKAQMQLLFGFVFLSLASAVILLILEKISFLFSYNYAGLWFAWFARCGVSFAGIFIAMIAITITYPERKKLFMTFVIISFTIFMIYAYYAIFSGPPNSDVVDGELVHGIWVVGIQLAIVLPTSNLSSIAFFYFAIINRDTGAGTRSFWMGFAIALFSIAYSLEIAPAAPIIAVPVRALYIISASILYYNFMRTPKE